MAVQKKPSGISKFSGKLSLIIPCYNEEQRIKDMISGLQEFELKCSFDYEIIVVNDGSTDGTYETILSDPFFRQLKISGKFTLIQLPENHGKGYALKKGIEAATGTHLLTLDADMSARPAEILNWMSANNNKLPQDEIWIASREHSSSKIKEIPSRRRTGRIFNLLVRFFTPLKLRDTQCGFKLYPSSIGKQIFSEQRSVSWAHDVELLYHASLKGITIRDMPIVWEAKPGSKISPVKDALPMLLSVMAVSIRLKLEYFVLTPIRIITNKDSAASLPDLEKRDSIFRLLFFATSLLLFLMMTSLSFNYGITGDDLDQKVYGETVLNFYTSFGKDASCLNLKVGNKENLYIYGGLFNVISAAANRYVGGLDEYDMRHLINSMAGFLAILFAGLLAKAIGNWMTGFLAIIFLATWPQFFGQSMNNSKDIPFALGYVFTIYYLIKSVKELPRPSLRTWIMVAIGIAFTINIRIGGLLLVGMMYTFVIGAYILSPEKRKAIQNTKSGGPLLIRLLIVTVAGYFGGLIFWPYGLLHPLSNPFIALKEMSNFSVGIQVLFGGKLLSSKEIPWYYIPQWLWITTPVIVLFAAIAYSVIWYPARKKFSLMLSLLILFAALFPWAYTVYQKSPLYDGMRQMLFIVPILAVMAALTWQFILTIPKQKFILYIITTVIIIGAVLPIRFSLANHPNEYVYFNELIGGIKGAYGKYDTDYYMNSIRKTSDWLKQTSAYNTSSKEKKILIGTNALDPVNWYFRNDSSKVKIVYVKWDAPGNPKTRSARDWDYGIFFSRNIDPSMLTKGTWPSQKAIYKNEADGIPLSAIIERKDKSDMIGYNAMQKDSNQLAEKYFEQALKDNPQNEEVALWMAQVKLSLHKYEDAIKYAQQYIELFPGSDEGYMLLGVANAYTNNFNNAVNNLNKAIQLNAMNYQAYTILGQLYQQSGDAQTAQQYFSQAKQIQQTLNSQ
ncbi:MAG: glycosyltransferase [Chitinophagales bacterium]|nr:glycosyltransferase [Chitinophagales bacterium]